MTPQTLGTWLYSPSRVEDVWVLSAEDHPDKADAERILSRAAGKPIRLGQPGTLTLSLTREPVGGPFGMQDAGYSWRGTVRVWVGEVASE